MFLPNWSDINLVDLVKILLENGADVNAKDINGKL